MVEPSRKVSRKKCGKIFSVSNEIFSLICDFCGDDFQELEDLRPHFAKHFPEIPTIINNEESSSDTEFIPAGLLDDANYNVKKEESISCGSDRESIEDDDVKYNSTDDLRGDAASGGNDYQTFPLVDGKKGEVARPNDNGNIKNQLELNAITKTVEKESTGAASNEDKGDEEELAAENMSSYRFQCDICKESFKRKDHIQRHMGKHNSEPFKCKLCSKSFSMKYILNRHQNTHTNKMSHICNVCQKSFTLNDSLTRHMKLHTGAEKPYTCDICSKTFSYKADLGRHMQTHSGQKPHKCEQCSMTFSRKAIAIRHMLTHSGMKPHKCDICGKRFSRKELVILHMILHTANKKKKPFKCDVCSQRFTQKSILGRHMHTHRVQKPRKCDICDKRFSYKPNFSRHMRTHTANPIKCRVCSKTFSRKYHLKRHLKTHTHESSPFKCSIKNKLSRGYNLRGKSSPNDAN